MTHDGGAEIREIHRVESHAAEKTLPDVGGRRRRLQRVPPRAREKDGFLGADAELVAL